MGNRRLSRELALQFLYQYDVLEEADGEKLSLESSIRGFWSGREPPIKGETMEFADMLVRGTCEHLDSIDSIIGDFSEHWRLQRMPKIDRNILRMGIYELIHLSSIPPAVTINEAVDLAKKYGTEQSGGFVNGILDKVRLALAAGEVKDDQGSDIQDN